MFRKNVKIFLRVPMKIIIDFTEIVSYIFLFFCWFPLVFTTVIKSNKNGRPKCLTVLTISMIRVKIVIKIVSIDTKTKIQTI